MTLWRGNGGTGSASSEVDTTQFQEFLVQSQAAQAAAEAARDAALIAETNAETAETNAETAEANATASANAAQDWATKTSGPVAGGEYSAKYNAQLAAASANAAAASLDAFDDRYLGAKASDPTVDNDGNPLITGTQYFNTVNNEIKVYNGTSWQSASVVGGTVTNLTVTNPIVGSITGNAGTVTNGVYTTGSYANPSWLTSLGWSKITSTPTTIAGYGITNAYTKTEVDTALATKQAADSELTTLAGMSASRATFLASNEGFGFRNRIINGDMRIDQRNNGASVTPTTDNTFTLDRWSAGLTQASKFSVQRSTTAATGFSNSLLATSLSAYSIGSGDAFLLNQNIEGFNVADLGWGTASAQTVTLSFWVRSSLTGTFGGVVANSAANRSYPFSYTISAANTWEQKTITIAGDTSGTWLTDNSVGMRVRFSLGAGSTYSGTAGAWAGSTLFSATGATSVVGTSGATFYITGVQLEAGTVASPFERRDYGRELMMCQRYFELIEAPTGATPTVGQADSTTTALVPISFRTTKRASPTFSTTGTLVGLTAGGGIAGGGLSLTQGNLNYARLLLSGASTLVAGNAVSIYASSNSTMQFSAEL